MESNKETTTFTDSIVFDVIKEIAERAEAGLAKYGTTMDRTDLVASDWVQHAYEEALDMAIYLKRLRKDMLAMEEELRAFKSEKIHREILWKEDLVTYKPYTSTSGTKIVYNTKSISTISTPKPNDTYTDEEPVIRKRYGFHR